MSITNPDQVLICVFGMRDSAVYDDVAIASRKTVELGATVVSSQDNPQISATFSNITQACTFAIWLSRRLVQYHTYQLTQVTHPSGLPWPDQHASTVHSNCILLVSHYNRHARVWHVEEIPDHHAALVAQALARTPLHRLIQEIAGEETIPPLPAAP